MNTNTMRILAFIFLGLGMVLNFLYAPLIFAGLGCAFGIVAFISLGNNARKTWIGVVSLIFTSLLGGIFYLCWNPEQSNNQER